MGDPRKLRKKYSNPKKPWEKSRLEVEKKIVEQYGLKNKHELRIAQAELRKIRRMAREFLSLGEEGQKKGKIILNRLMRLGIANESTTLDDLLALDVHSILDRRLQTVVRKQGLAKTIKQARQFITHGHIAVNGTRVTAPGYIVKTNDTVSYYGGFAPFDGEDEKKKEKKEKDEEKEEKEVEVNA